MSLQDTILSCLHNLGITLTDSSKNEDLRLFGMDSLQIVLLISELEKKLNITFNLDTFKEEDFYYLKSLEKLMQSYLR